MKYTGFLLNSSGLREANYGRPIYNTNSCPYIHSEYKNFSERFKEAEILIPRFSIPDQNVNLREMFEMGKNQELIYIFAFQCLFGF